MKPYYEHGGITIYHGDCLGILPQLFVSPSLPDLVLTDPPYGICLDSHGTHFKERTITGDNDQLSGQLIVWLCDAAAWPLIIFCDPLHPFNGEWRQALVWDKGACVGSGGDPEKCWRFEWEMIQIARLPKLNGGRDCSVLRFPVRAFAPEFDFKFHPAQKPIPLLAYLISKTTQEGQTVTDPFCGSGSTLVAAKKLGRKAIGIEIEEKYCEIAAKRLSQEVFQF